MANVDGEFVALDAPSDGLIGGFGAEFSPLPQGAGIVYEEVGFEDTWEYQTGIQAKFETTNDSARDKVWHMIGLKRAITGESTAFTTLWTVAGSGGEGAGGGGGMDGVDRWENLRANADATNNWMCLRGPAGTQLADIWFTMINGGSNQTARFVVTDEAPTGGGETTAPTFSGKIIDRPTANVMGRWDGDIRPVQVTIGMSSEGSWYFFASGDIGEHCSTMWILARTAEDTRKTGDMPCVMHVSVDPGAQTLFYAQHESNWYAYHKDGSTTLCAPLTVGYHSGSSSLTSVMWNLTIPDSWDTEQKIPSVPIYLYATDSGKQAFRGRVVDLYLSPQAAPNNITEPVGGSVESVTMNYFWLPATSRVTV